MSSGRKAKKNRRAQSTLQQHKRQGKNIFQPPMRTIPNTTTIPWLRDVFPDMLWICSTLYEQGEAKGMNMVAAVLDRITALMPRSTGHDGIDVPALLTGTLTSFDQVPQELRGEVLSALHADGLYEKAFPHVLVDALSKYEDLPGRWIFEGWNGDAEVEDSDDSEEFLRGAIRAAPGGGSSLATKSKATVIRAYIVARKMVFGYQSDWMDALPRYPHDVTEDERQRLESTLRAMFNMLVGLPLTEDGADVPMLQWAKSFWRQNWSLYDCVGPDSSGSDLEVDVDDPAPWQDALAKWVDEVRALEEQFLEAQKSADPNLYFPDRHEVLSGITYRHLRAVEMMVRFPGYWTTEHGSPTLRNLVESRIVLKWLIQQDDPELYRKFKDYGRGRLKLLLLHLREHCDGMEKPPQELLDQVEYLDALVNQEIWEEYQDISIEKNFANKDVRRMAEEVGLMSDYRLVFAPTSSILHGEWGQLDQFVLTPCGNPLHRGHRIPNTDPNVAVGPGIVESALVMLGVLVDDYCRALSGSPTDGS